VGNNLIFKIMPVSFNVIQRPQQGVAGGGVKKFYAIAVSKGEATLRELAKEISQISTVSSPDTLAVLEALLLVVPKYIADGKIVRLGEFGSFGLTISSEGYDTEEEVTSKSIKGNSLNFKPGSELKVTLENIKYEKA
jgi:predicted histone-like DNA-binding protein